MNVLLAFAWLRWRVLMNSIERSGARDTLERFSLAIEQLGPIMAALLMVPSAILLAGAGAYAGWALARGTTQPLVFEVLRFLFVAATALTIVGPLMLPAGDRANAVRMLLLPISRRMLYAAQTTTTFADPWLLLAVAPIVALPLGLLAGGAWLAALVSASAGLLFLLVLTGLASLVISAIQLVVRDRRRGELVALLIIVVLPLAGILPVMLAGDRGRRDESQARQGRSDDLPGWITTIEHRALPLIPSEMFARATRTAASGELRAPVAALGSLALVATALHGAGLFVFGRVLDAHGSTRSGRRGSVSKARTWRIRGLSTGASAVAVNQVRLALRTPRGRSILLSPLVVFLMFGVMMWRGGNTADFGFLRLTSGVALAIFGSTISLLALLPLSMNQFAIDRAGLTLTFLSPLDDWDVLKGKAIGNAIVAGMPAFVCIAGAAAVFPGGPWSDWVSVILGLAASYMLTAPVAAALSALFPRPVDLNSIGNGSNAHAAAGLLGLVVLLCAGALTVALALLARLMFGHAHFALVAMLIWCGLSAAVSRLCFIPARSLLARRRENLALTV